MNVIINDAWYYAVEIKENEFAVEIPEGHIEMFRKIQDDAHLTQGRSKLLFIPYAFLSQEVIKGKSSSKCKIGYFKFSECYQIVENYHKDNPYAFFKYTEKE